MVFIFHKLITLTWAVIMSALSAVPHILSDKTREMVSQAKVFVVGAGGIGCEILKNLALSGFTDIEIVSKLHICKNSTSFTTF